MTTPASQSITGRELPPDMVDMDLPPQAAEPLVAVEGLHKNFATKTGSGLWKKTGWVRAVDGLNFNVRAGETFGLVGESGCGKSTTGKVILRVLEPSQGRVLFKGRDVSHLKGKDLLKFRSQVQAVYQDPYSSLNPRMRIDHSVAEPLVTHQLMDKKDRRERVAWLMRKVGLLPEHAQRYPHEFSGGQRQRIGIARALAINPKFLVLDEPVSALDVSIQAQILNLLADLQKDFKLTYLFISHDLSVVEHICNRVAVMYLGKIVEQAESSSLFADPLHPYTQALLSAVPVADPDYLYQAIPLQGEIPSPLNPPPGCRFHPRCPRCMEICRKQDPPRLEKEPGHLVYCHLYN